MCLAVTTSFQGAKKHLNLYWLKCLYEFDIKLLCVRQTGICRIRDSSLAAPFPISHKGGFDRQPLPFFPLIWLMVHQPNRQPILSTDRQRLSSPPVNRLIVVHASFF